MSLAGFDKGLFARKGEAAPTPFVGCVRAEEAFVTRRRLVLVAPEPPGNAPGTAHRTAPEPIPVGSLRQERPKRLRFTFRVAPAQHAELAAASKAAGISRQRYLEEALDARLSQDLRRIRG